MSHAVPFRRVDQQVARCSCGSAGNPYADEHGAFGDNVFRYTLLSMAACEAPLLLPIGGYRCVPNLLYDTNTLIYANQGL